MSLEIKGKFGVEIFDKNTDEFVKKIETPNTVVNAGILQIARWLSRQQFPDSDTTKFGAVKRTWDEFSAINIADGAATRIFGNYNNANPFTQYALDGFDSSYDSHYIANGNYYQSWVVDFQNPIDLKAVGIIGHRDHFPMEVGYNMMFVRYKGYQAASAGDTTYNGDWQTRWIEYNGKPSFKHVSNERYLFSDPSGYWIMSDSMGGSAGYSTSDIVEEPYLGTWTIGTAAVPVPTVSDKQSDSRWFTPSVNYDQNTNQQGRWFTWYNKDWDVDNPTDTGDNYSWISENQMGLMSFEGCPQFTEHDWYGTLREVDGFRLYHYHNDGDGRFSFTWRLRKVEAFVENQHPHNPSVIRLGTDDGTILPLASGNAALGAYSTGLEWKCDTVIQPSGQYKVRFLKSIGAGEANDISIKEIGLFMDADGHLNDRIPDIENCNDLFARSIFATPWTKDNSQYATLYYEIEVS